MTRENCLPFSDEYAKIPADSTNQQSRFYTMKPDGGSPLCHYEDTSFGGNRAIWHVFGAYELWSRISSQVKENLNSSYL
jgi:hypothetical protein